MRVYARCVVGLEDVWIVRMDAALRLARDDPPLSRTGAGHDGNKMEVGRK